MNQIQNIAARTILDSRGDWTVETELTLTDGSRAKASVPTGKSRGRREDMVTPAAAA